MKIGILTYHRSVNYGAFLQAYFLATAIQNKYPDATVELIDYTSRKALLVDIQQVFKGDAHYVMKRMKRFFVFQENCDRHMPISKSMLVTDNLDKVSQFIKKMEYDAVIVGSDEVWKINGSRGFPNAYWLSYDIGDAKRISYAASSRNYLEKCNSEEMRYLEQAVQRYYFVGVRDSITKEQVEKVSHMECELCCDPTFLRQLTYDKATYVKKIRKLFHIPEGKKIMGLMLPYESVCEKIREAYSDKYYLISIFEWMKSADKNCISLSPFEWIKMIGCFDFFITTRFHGTVFAIKNEVPFLAIDDYDQQEQSRIYYLLKSNGLENRFIQYKNSNYGNFELLKKISKLMNDKDDRSKYVTCKKNEYRKSKKFWEIMSAIGKE